MNQNSNPLLRWFLKDIEVKMENNLESKQRIKTYRGFKKQTSVDVILKIITMNQNTINQLQTLIENAKTFYKRQTTIQDLILPGQHVTQFKDTFNTPNADKKQDQLFNLYLTRPYFVGNNFHNSIYIDQSIPYKMEQFPTFIKQSISLFSQIYYAQLLEPTCLPTLENVYIDGVNLNANLLSVETYLFLKHKMAHLSVENFKHLFILLKSDPSCFVNWQKMQNYMSEQILCRSLLILWICLMTLRSPVEIIWQTPINDQQLEWDRLIQNTTNLPSQGTSPNQHKINQDNKVIQLIRNAPKQWQKLLDKPQNIKCFQIFSEMMFQSIKSDLPSITPLQNNSNQSNYFYNLFKKVFVQQKSFGWKELFSHKQIFLYLRKSNTVEQKKETKKEQQTSQTQRINRSKKIRTQLLKESFFYVHKYFLYKDIVNMSLSKQQRDKYAKKLIFNTYLPYKIGLKIEDVLSYKNWFQIFLVENKDQRPQIYQKAFFLYELMEKKCGDLLQHIKYAQLYHIKRILFLLGQKIERNRQFKKFQKNSTYGRLQEEIRTFRQNRRPYQYSLRSFGKYLQLISKSESQKPILGQLQVDIAKKIHSSVYDDQIILYAAYFLHQQDQTKQSIHSITSITQEEKKNSIRLNLAKKLKIFIKQNQNQLNTIYNQQFIKRLNDKFNLGIAKSKEFQQSYEKKQFKKFYERKEFK